MMKQPGVLGAPDVPVEAKEDELEHLGVDVAELERYAAAHPGSLEVLVDVLEGVLGQFEDEVEGVYRGGSCHAVGEQREECDGPGRMVGGLGRGRRWGIAKDAQS